MVFFKHKYISNPIVTAVDAVIDAAKKMADALKTKMNLHLGKEARTTLSNLQKIFARAAVNKKAAKDPAQYRPTKKMTHLPEPAFNPAPGILSVESPIIPGTLRDKHPPPRVAFRPPTRVVTPRGLYPPTT